MFSVFFFKQKTAYEMRISDWSSDVCSSDLSPDPVTISDGQGTATIRNDDDPLPVMSINNITVTEGDSGQVKANFTASLSAPSKLTVSATYLTEEDRKSVV